MPETSHPQPLSPERRPRIKLSFAWYDLWVGAFIDQAKRRLYICPLPCLLITIQLPLSHERNN
jgi:hypothetical protein